MRDYARGIYQPKAPVGWLLRSKFQDQCKPIFYKEKPRKFNQELFDIVPLYEVIADYQIE